MDSPFIEHVKNKSSFIFYSNNNEYRQIIRDIFLMDPSIITPYSDLSVNEIEISTEIDEESIDEMQYDMKKMDMYLTELYELTNQVPEFLQLYKRAAVQMLSEDPLIGQVVLCSYNYFNLYFACIWFYLHGGKLSLMESVEYTNLTDLLK